MNKNAYLNETTTHRDAKKKTPQVKFLGATASDGEYWALYCIYPLCLASCSEVCQRLGSKGFRRSNRRSCRWHPRRWARSWNSRRSVEDRNDATYLKENESSYASKMTFYRRMSEDAARRRPEKPSLESEYRIQARSSILLVVRVMFTFSFGRIGVNYQKIWEWWGAWREFGGTEDISMAAVRNKSPSTPDFDRVLSAIAKR